MLFSARHLTHIAYLKMVAPDSGCTNTDAGLWMSDLEYSFCCVHIDNELNLTSNIYIWLVMNEHMTMITNIF